jgi:hypothetical protein
MLRKKKKVKVDGKADGQKPVKDAPVQKRKSIAELNEWARTHRPQPYQRKVLWTDSTS